MITESQQSNKRSQNLQNTKVTLILLKKIILGLPVSPSTNYCKFKCKDYNLAALQNNPSSFPGKKKVKRDPVNDTENNSVQGEVDIRVYFTNTNQV